MIIDSSAFIAILLGESETQAFVQAIANDPKRLASAFSVLETAVVMESKKGLEGSRNFDLLLHEAKIDVVSMNADQIQIARRAYSRFGKGRHQAALNLGDCCSYALSQYAGQALLFKGNDFSQTDITVVTL